MCRKINRINKIRHLDPVCEKMISGFHIEGPYLNESAGYIGAHPSNYTKLSNIDDTQRLLESAQGLTKLVTLAPERDPNYQVTAMLKESGITVSAGHCNPTRDEIAGAIDNGLTMFTHLGNGCPRLLERHNNIIQRILEISDSIWISFIADGIHIPFPVLNNYLKIIPTERAIAVTDAISAARMKPGQYTLGKWDLVIEEDGVAMSPDRSHLVGSTLTAPKIIDNLKNKLNLNGSQIKEIIHTNPRAAIQS
jgi:N-acetylglucosamine-6-phosphate deacetylase